MWDSVGIAAERRPAGAGGGEGGGAVVMFDVKELKEVRRVGMPSHVAAVKWHPKINQIFVGIGESVKGIAEDTEAGRWVVACCSGVCVLSRTGVCLWGRGRGPH
jgi:hypothetical protein